MDYKKQCMRYLDRQGIKYKDKDEFVLSITYTGSNLNSIPIMVFFDKDGDGIIQLDCWEIANFKGDKRETGIKVCNELNSKYRWIKFYVDNDGDIRAQLDAYVDMETVGDVTSRLVKRAVSIIDKGYPVIMKALWA